MSWMLHPKIKKKQSDKRLKIHEITILSVDFISDSYSDILLPHNNIW